ncbi:MAG: LacI family DNA-binding transcriptional regulator [Chloroflexota bacterium]
MKEKAGIKDIAKQLGISPATVSRALNDKPGVSANLRQRVLAVAAELSFTPNLAARSLVGAATLTAAFMVHQQGFPVASDPFYFVILRGVERALAEAGYHVVLATVGDGAIQADHLRVIRERRVDGAILAGPDIPPALIMSLVQTGMPLVLVDNALERTALNCVLCDNREGARFAVEHLLWHGHRRVAFAGGPISWLSTRERGDGYREAMRERGLETVAVHEDATTVQTGVHAGHALLDLEERPDAIFAVNDAMALGVIRAARERGLRVPEDLAVVGFDDISMAESSHPTLTTVRIAKELMGEIAARRLLELVAWDRDDSGGAGGAGAAGTRADRGDMSEHKMPVKSVVGTTLVVRASCGCTSDAQVRG